MIDRLPLLSTQVARLVEQLGAQSGVRVERVTRDCGRWVVHAACANAEALHEAFDALARVWPQEAIGRAARHGRIGTVTHWSIAHIAARRIMRARSRGR